MKSLVIYYSLSGHTHKVAEKLSETLKCDLEDIKCGELYHCFFGYIRAGYHSWKGYMPSIEPEKHVPVDYDLVLIGTPIWVGRIAAPMRTYLKAHKGDIKRVGFFLTYGGSDPTQVFKELEDLCGCNAEAKLSVLTKDINNGHFTTQVEGFAKNFQDIDINIENIIDIRQFNEI